jgi:hypothetical protein
MVIRIPVELICYAVKHNPRAYVTEEHAGYFKMFSDKYIPPS